jgi:hypothetical protein
MYRKTKIICGITSNIETAQTLHCARSDFQKYRNLPSGKLLREAKKLKLGNVPKENLTQWPTVNRVSLQLKCMKPTVRPPSSP